ncbi:histidine phosphatase family protein [Acidobacteriota bacterium]
MGIRQIYLVRHGQHIKDKKLDPGSLGPSLTGLGIRQAKHTAKALSTIGINAVHCSSLTRAKQTAEIIALAFPGIKVRPSRLLWECVPTRIKSLPIDKNTIEQDRERAERVLLKHFKPARVDRHEIIVAHGNLIRYLVCRVLGLRRTAWSKLGTFNCSITRVMIDPKGPKILLSFNENHHIPSTLRTSI